MMGGFLPYNPPLKKRRKGIDVKWYMIVVSIFIHALLVTGIAAFSTVHFALPPADFVIGISEVPIATNDLPPLGDTKEAGAPSTKPPQQEIIQPEVKEEIPEPEIEETKPEPKKEEPVKTPDPKPEPKKEPVKTEPKKVETKPKPKNVEPDTKVVSTKSTPVKDPEPEPEIVEPSPQEVAQELKSRQAAFSTRSSVAGTTQERVIASESDPGGGGGPMLYRNVLMQRIGGIWNPPLLRTGEIRDATVQFTIYSPPLKRNSSENVRTARISNVRIIKSSNDLEFDAKALEAVRRLSPCPPLPDSYRKETLVVICRFYLLGEE